MTTPADPNQGTPEQPPVAAQTGEAVEEPTQSEDAVQRAQDNPGDVEGAEES